MQDKFATFDIAVDLTTAGVSGTGFNAGAVGAYTSINGPNGGGSYDTYATGVPNAVGPSLGTIGGPLLHDLGRGIRLKFYSQIVLAVTSAGAATLEVDFICADTQDLVTNQTVLIQSPAIAKTALVAGYRYRHGTTPGVVPRRFVGALYTIGGATITAGKITSGLMLDVDDHADVLG
jgi:hypothetical protein